jgi:hypothetical protein
MDAVEGPVGEDHAEPEGVVGTVAFEHGDLGRRVSAAHQRGEEQSAGAASGDGDAHPQAPAGMRVVASFAGSGVLSRRPGQAQRGENRLVGETEGV